MTEYPVVTLPLDAFDTDPENVYRHEDGDLQRLTHMIQEHGFLVPVVVDAASERDGHYTLVGGEARVEAARLAGRDSIPAILASFDSPDQRRAAAIALNAPYGHWDDDALSAMLRGLDATIDLDLTGLPSFRVQDLIATTPALDELTKKWGDYAEQDAWPVIRLKVTPDAKARWDAYFDTLEGETDDDRLRIMLDALSVA